MGGFLSAVSQKLADRWFTLLVLPGALYLAALVTADVLGQAHALDPALLARRVNAWTKTPGTTDTGDQVLLLAAVLAGAAAAGLAAQAIGRVVESLVLAAGWTDWPRPLRGIAGWLVQRRRDRWTDANAEYQRIRNQMKQARTSGGARPDPTRRDRAYLDLLRIADSTPQRPTWSGDRIDAVGRRLHDDLGLDTARIWPALWLIVPDTVRTEVTDARTGVSAAAALVGWAALYAPITGWWWPAAPIAIALAVAGFRRFRNAAETYALLIETVVRLHTVELADRLHVPKDVPLIEIGRAVTRQLSPGGTISPVQPAPPVPPAEPAKPRTQ